MALLRLEMCTGENVNLLERVKRKNVEDSPVAVTMDWKKKWMINKKRGKKKTIKKINNKQREIEMRVQEQQYK